MKEPKMKPRDPGLIDYEPGCSPGEVKLFYFILIIEVLFFLGIAIITYIMYH